MKSNKLYLQLLSLIAAAISMSLGCEGKAKFENSPPSEVTLSRDRCYIWTGGRVKFVASAKDEDGDPLIFTWRATKGSFDPPSAAGSTIYWIAPQEPGAASITMSVTDELETVSLAANVVVGVEFPENIVTMTIRDEGYVYILKKSSPVQVPSGSVLTVEPGVVIVIDNRYGGFSVDGALVALGTSGKHIKFIGNTFTGGNGLWGGIGVNGPDGEANLSNVEILNGDDGLWANNGASVELNACTIYDNASLGIWATDGSSLKMRKCSVVENGVGVYVRNSDASLVLSTIEDNAGDGVQLSASNDSSMMVIDSCTVANNSGNGIALINMANPAIHYCLIFNADPNPGTYTIRLESYTGVDSIHAERNYWGLGFNTAQKISAVILDKTDDPASVSAWVGFIPWLDSPPVMSEVK